MRILSSPFGFAHHTWHFAVLAMVFAAGMHGYSSSSSSKSSPPPRVSVPRQRTAPPPRPAQPATPFNRKPQQPQRQQPRPLPAPQPQRPTPNYSFGASTAPRIFAGERVVNTQGGGQRIYDRGGRLRFASANGMNIQRGPGGARIVSSIRPDGSRVTVWPGGNGWVQHPFSYRGIDYARRTYVVHSVQYSRFYRVYSWGGQRFNIYTPVSYYPSMYYWSLGRMWGSPAFSWGWQSAGWYGSYGRAFTPYSTYYTPSMWLTDYTLANGMDAAYQQDQADGSANEQPAPVVPVPNDVKNGVNQEIQNDISVLQRENQQESVGQPQNSPAGSVAEVLGDNRPHTFIAGEKLMLIDSGGTECALSPGDIVQYTPPAPAPNAPAVNVQVTWSKGAKDCVAGTTVGIALDDLQEMHNHMLATVDHGIDTLHTEQDAGKLPGAQGVLSNAMAHSYVLAAPQSDSAAQSELNAQSQEADKVEQMSTNQ